MRTLPLTTLMALAVTCAAPPGAAPATEAPPSGERLASSGSLAMPRASHTATLLPDGTVLIAGGYDGECGIAATELFDPATGTTSSGPSLGVPRCSHSATALPDGRVLIAGGWSGPTIVGSAEAYDPRTRTFAPAAPMREPRAAHLAVALADGRVLVAGGSHDAGIRASAELYDPRSGTWAMTGELTVPRVAAAGVRLSDGMVLIAGGSPRRGEVVASAERFDPATGTFSPTGSMAVARHKHAATLLPDGSVLIVGGSDARDGVGQHATTELYDARTRTFSASATMSVPRFKLPDAVVTLAGGDVLVAGGGTRAEVFEPARRAFRVVSGSFGTARSFATATALRDGSVLIAGGYDERIRVTASLFRYHR